MRSFEATPKLIKLLGKEWAGEYQVHILSAEEYIKMGNVLFRKGEEIPRSEWNFQTFLRCVTHNGKPIEKNVPPKIMEMLMSDVIELNAYTLTEERKLFLRPSTAKPREKDTSQT